MPVIDLHTLAVALQDAIEFERPKNFDVINFIGTHLAQTQLGYQKVVEWIPKAPGGVLKEISITSDPNASIKLELGAREKFKDVVLQAVLTLDYQRMRVAGGGDKNITVWAKSTSGVAYTIQAVINAEQIL